MKTDRRNIVNVRFLVMSTATRATGLAVVISLYTAVSALGQTDTPGHERLFSGHSIVSTVTEGTIQDCNANGVPDERDIADGTSVDCNLNGIPDECELDRSFAAHMIADGGASIFPADLDGDGDTDVLLASYRDDKITWHENTDGLGTFGPQRIITAIANGPNSVLAADLDGDGDADVLSASSRDDIIAWYENTDGLGTFGEQQVITEFAQNPRLVLAADLDGDGDFDVLSASYNYGNVAWYENTDGSGTFGPQLVIATGAIDRSFTIFAADLDGDGDTDVLSGANTWWFPYESKVAWHENTDGEGTFGREQVIDADVYDISSVSAADLDGDGDIDFLASFAGSSRVAWYENKDGKGTFGPQQVISVCAGLVTSVFATDLDDDGDIDVLSSSSTLSELWVLWYENTDGRGSFGSAQIISVAPGGGPYSGYGPDPVSATDMDGDGDMDVLSTFQFGGNTTWLENPGYIPDCNHNDVPDDCDIADGVSTDCNASDVPDECEPGGRADVDGDGVVELCDLCPDSQMNETLMLNGCDTGVAEFVFDDGCSLADMLDECRGDALNRNHGDYVSCVTYVAREWKSDGVVTGREFGRIVSCAAKTGTTKHRALRTDDDGRK